MLELAEEDYTQGCKGKYAYNEWIIRNVTRELEAL